MAREPQALPVYKDLPDQRELLDLGEIPANRVIVENPEKTVNWETQVYGDLKGQWDRQDRV